MLSNSGAAIAQLANSYTDLRIIRASTIYARGDQLGPLNHLKGLLNLQRQLARRCEHEHTRQTAEGQIRIAGIRQHALNNRQSKCKGFA